MKIGTCVALLGLAVAGCNQTSERTRATPASEPHAVPPPVDSVPEGKTTNREVGPMPVSVYIDPGAPRDLEEAVHAIAVLAPTKDNEAHGIVRFDNSGTKLKVKAELHGLPPGKHAYHIHLFGDCSADDGKSAGTHFNFTGSSKQPVGQQITGNLGELEADDAGNASAEASVEDAQLQGRFSIIGRAVVVHEKGNDDDKPPSGAAGGRLACGVIGVADGKRGGT